MQIRLLYRGRLLSTSNDRLKPIDPERDRDIHRVRRLIHRQLSVLWEKHPALKRKRDYAYTGWSTDWKQYNPGHWVDLSQWKSVRRPEGVYTQVEALMH